MTVDKQDKYRISSIWENDILPLFQKPFLKVLHFEFKRTHIERGCRSYLKNLKTSSDFLIFW